jgi:hypothetical protein
MYQPSTFQEWVSENPSHEEVVEYLTQERASLEPGARYPNSFLLDLANLIRNERPLTDPQVISALATIRRRRDAAERTEDSATRPKSRAPLGTQTFTGEVVGIKSVANKFAKGQVMKIMIECDGWKTWGTCPKALRYVHAPHGDRPLGAGDMVQITAEIKPSDDPSLGYFSAPREVTYLGPVSARAAS